MKFIGVDIGSTGVRAIEVQPVAKGIEILRFIEHPLTLAQSQDPDIEIVDFLRTTFGKTDPQQTKFIFGLRQELLSTRIKSFPFREKPKITKSLPFELEDEIPFDVDSAVLEGKILSFNGNTAEVMTSAVIKENVARFLDKLRSSGIEPTILSSEGFALSTLFEKWQDAPPERKPVVTMSEDDEQAQRSMHGVLHLGHTRSLLCIFEDNVLMSVRSFFWGGQRIAETLARKYQMPYLEALKVFQTKAFLLLSREGATQDQIVFSNTIGTVLDELVSELRITLLEIRGDLRCQIQGIGIVGGTSQIINLGPWLTQKIEIPVNKISVLDKFPIVHIDKATEPRCLIALGLAFEGVRRPRNPAVNFLKGDLIRAPQRARLLWAKWGHAATVVAAAFFCFVVFSIFREEAAMNLSDISRENLKAQVIKSPIAGLSATKGSPERVKKWLREQDKKSTEIKTLAKLMEMNSPLDLLKKITDASPSKENSKIDIQEFSTVGQTIRLEGWAGSPADVAQLQTALSAVAIEKKVLQLQPKTVPPPGKSAFRFEIKMDRNVHVAAGPAAAKPIEDALKDLDSSSSNPKVEANAESTNEPKAKPDSDSKSALDLPKSILKGSK